MIANIVKILMVAVVSANIVTGCGCGEVTKEEPVKIAETESVEENTEVKDENYFNGLFDKYDVYFDSLDKEYPALAKCFNRTAETKFSDKEVDEIHEESVDLILRFYSDEDGNGIYDSVDRGEVNDEQLEAISARYLGNEE